MTNTSMGLSPSHVWEFPQITSTVKMLYSYIHVEPLTPVRAQPIAPVLGLPDIAAILYMRDNMTITFNWNPQGGFGPETVVDNYRLDVSPAPLSDPASFIVYSSPQNVTIEYNRVYTANVTAINCVGESKPLILSSGLSVGECSLIKAALLVITLKRSSPPNNVFFFSFLSLLFDLAASFAPYF